MSLSAFFPVGFSAVQIKALATRHKLSGGKHDETDLPLRDNGHVLSGGPHAYSPPDEDSVL